MSGSLSNHAENLIQKWLFTALSASRPAARYLALHSAAPGEAGTVAELTALGRKSITFGAPAALRVANTNTVTFTAPDSITRYRASHWTIWDADTAGNCLGWGNFKSTISFNLYANEKRAPDSKAFAAGAILCYARGLASFAAELALNWLFRSASVTRPTDWFMALHRALPDEDGAGGEFALLDCTREAVAFGTPAAGVLSNSDPVSFGPASADWPKISHYSLWDAVSAGNCFLTKPLAAALDVPSGGTMDFAAGAVVIGAN